MGVIFSGRLIQVGTPGELKRSSGELSVISIETPSLSDEQISKIRSLSDVCKVSYEDPVLRVTCAADVDVAEHVTKTLVLSGAKIRSINTEEPSLEDAFISLTGGEEEIDRFLQASSSGK